MYRGFVNMSDQTQSYNESLAKQIIQQNNIQQNIFKLYLSPYNSALGGTSEMITMPNPKFIDLAFKVLNQKEKDEFLRELLQASLSSIETGNTENIRRVLLAWEYTALWKKEPKMFEEIAEEDSIESGTDWREFLDSEGV